MRKIPEKYLKPFDYLFLFRPTLFFPVWIIVMSGLCSGHFFAGNPIWWSFSISGSNVLVFFLVTLACGATFILNQLQSSGEVQSKRFITLISSDNIRAEAARKIAITSIIISLAGLILIDIQVLIFMTFVVLLWGYMFNYKPFEWKNSLPMGIIVYLISGLLLFLIGWTLSGNNPFDAMQVAIPYVTAWMSVVLLTLIDFSRDESSGLTVEIKSRRRTTGAISLILLIITFILSLINQDPIISLPSLLSLPLFITMVIKPTESWIIRSIRYPILFLALLLSCEYPLFFLVLLTSYHLCKNYYYSRFNLIYPTFQVGEEAL